MFSPASKEKADKDWFLSMGKCINGCIGEEKDIVRQFVCYYSCILCLEVVMQSKGCWEKALSH